MLVTALLLALAAGAGAATRNAITPLAPKAGHSVPAGKAVLFRMRVTEPGSVFVRVCKASRRNEEGIICKRASILGPARKRDGAFEVREKFFDFPAFWLNQPGRYYWQAYRIECTGGSDCKQEGPVVRFRVT